MLKAIFLDRDGVINDNKRHVNKPADLIIYKEAKEAIKKAADAGYELFVVTNQGGIELGHLTHEKLAKIHEKMVRELEPYGKIRAIKYCPYFHTKSSLRKPEPGMILELAKEYDLDLANSWMIGDMETDIEAGKRAGCKTGKIGKPSEAADINGEDLLKVIEQII